MTGDLIHSYSAKLREFKSDFTKNYLAIGAILSTVKKEKLFGPESTFVEWVTSEGMSRSWAYRCCQIYERFEDRGMGILPDRLTALLPLKLSPEQETEALTAARDLPAGGFVDFCRTLQKKVPSDTEGCEHDFQLRCKRCGRIGE